MPPSYTHTVNPDQATFLGFGLEGVAYGINVILFGIAIRFLLRRRSRGNQVSNLAILAFSCLMFALCTVHYALNFNNVYNGTMVHVRHISDETPLQLGADTIWLLTDFFSQLLLIYRCYLVWGKSIWIIILPLLIALASVSCGLGVTGLLISIDPNAPQLPVALVPLGDGDFALSLILNFMMSSLIVGRIWWMSRNSSLSDADASTSIQKPIGIVIESGLLFLTIQFIFVVLFAIAHPAQAVVEPIAEQIYVISPMLIVVRVGMGAAYEPTKQTGVPESLRFAQTGGTHTTHTA
ncbi:hypothetical protein B0H16DRAFT_1885414 [Mycena metata]|uniref:Uncharacterized protein n=1 Tax=Mycena metata TaxID=1033252 RepID=A0AAD7J8M4_9AGAR|nr:hypothetical protein B0H16DRAFT_1885414 [Mycena metata]